MKGHRRQEQSSKIEKKTFWEFLVHDEKLTNVFLFCFNNLNWDDFYEPLSLVLLLASSCFDLSGLCFVQTIFKQELER